MHHNLDSINKLDTKIKNEDILQLFCEKNSDGTKHLRLKGKELQQRFGYVMLCL